MTAPTPPAQPAPSTAPPAAPAPAPGAPPAVPAVTFQPPATLPAAPKQQQPQPPAAPPAQAPQAPGAPTQQGQQPPQVYVPPGYMLVPAQGQAPAQQGPQYVPVAPLPPAQQEGNDPDRDISRLPGWAQSLISDLRKENAERRVSERTAVVTQHGLAAAMQLGVNPAALLSSVPWTEAARQLNPSDPEFPQKLTETIQRIVAASPWMKAETTQPQPQQPPAAPPPATSGGDFSAGSGSGVPITREQLAQMTPEQIAEAFKAGKLRHLLT